MTEQRVSKTWDPFWGELILRRFHEDNPERWSAREAKADWLAQTLSLTPGDKIVDLGCGDGVLDICLARRGYNVTAIDRIASVINSARQEAEACGVAVNFVASDLRQHEFGQGIYNAAIFFDIFGLMNREDELNLFTRLHSALTSDAHLVVDWPMKGSTKNWDKSFSDGVLKVQAYYDEAERVQYILPEFSRTNGCIIELHDPLHLPEYKGLRRYIYLLDEAQELIASAGFESKVVPHYRNEGYYMLLCRKI